MHRRLSRLNGEVVHHLDGRRQHARRDNIAHRGARLIGGVKRREERLHALKPVMFFVT